ncbi:MAG: translesion error-prone DNA polymerase V subunit UmuC [Thermodesulfobacteriota bacterium]|nr:translesion error-prone DNA polymerase V subunit UmuC [Thermodesulfobacteriota bacterium]
MKPVYALVDCNNFYASCERLFQPRLNNAPIVVLSNNDGCIVARSKEAKALGIPMAQPLFKVRALLEKHHVHIFSSNYALYADISARVMRTLEELSPAMEIYSIDEAFLNLTGMDNGTTLNAIGQTIRHTVYRHVGIPVCVGIAPTKTLAKLANHGAKSYAATNGVVDLSDKNRQQRLLNIIEVAQVWGVGEKTAEKLRHQGISTALQLAHMNPQQAQRRYSVTLNRIIHELNGEPCIMLDENPPSRKQMICSRSFAEKIDDYTSLRETVCEFAARVSEKLRSAQQSARIVQVFIRTSPFNSHDRCYANSATGILPMFSCDSRDILRMVTKLFDQIWKTGYHYAKAGVMLGELSDSATIQPGLFDSDHSSPHSKELMQAIDTINHSGRSNIWLGAQRPDSDWFMSRKHLSPAYTTRWDCLPLVK